MDYWLIWSLVLFAVGLVIVVVEVIVPSGGILGIAAFGALVGSLYCAYQLNAWAAAALAGIELVCVPIVVVLAFKILPKTSLGRQLILSPPTPPPVTGNPAASASGDGYSWLLGVEGKAATMLRPSGTAEIGGRRVSVVTRGEMISLGSAVRVIEVEGNRVVVEAI